MNILVLYNSRKGHTQSLAEHIVQIVTEKNHTARMKSIIEVQASDITSADMIFLGTWVHGMILFNVRPAGADLWVKNLPDFHQKPVALFCTYAFNPRNSLKMLGDLLKGRGARIIDQQAFHQKRLTTGLDAFVDRTLKQVMPTPQ